MGQLVSIINSDSQHIGLKITRKTGEKVSISCPSTDFVVTQKAATDQETAYVWIPCSIAELFRVVEETYRDVLSKRIAETERLRKQFEGRQ